VRSILFLLTLGCLPAQPFVFYRGVSNAASYTPSGLPNAPLARGSIFAIFGRGIGPATGVQASAFPLANTLAGTSIELCQGTACVAAIPIFVRQDQVNAIVPSNAPLGEVSLRVTYNGVTGNYTWTSVAARSVGIFTINSGGFGPAVAQNFVSPTEQPVNSLALPAKPGQTMILWGTGLGAGLNADNVAPQPGDLVPSIDIWVGGKPVTAKRYHGRSACCSGLDQIVFDLPADTPLGCYVPIQLAAGGVVSNTGTIAVSADGAACTDSFNPVSERFRRGGRLGMVAINRTNTLRNFVRQQPEEILESALASFRNVAGGAFYFNPEISLPPVGACTAQTMRGNLYGGDELPGFLNAGAELDAGAEIRVAGKAVEREDASKLYQGLLATSYDTPSTALPPTVAVSGASSGAVGAFQFSIAGPAPLAFLNRAALDEVDRSQGLTLNWQGGDAARDVTLVMLVSVKQAENASVRVLCTAAGGDGSFTIPPHLLQLMPRLEERVGEDAFSYVSVGRVSLRAPGSFEASGLDQGMAWTGQWSSRAVIIP